MADDNTARDTRVIYLRRQCSPVGLRQRMNARRSAQAAQRAGTLTPQPCEVCGTTEDVEKHHGDYNQPLTVRWLCKTHHGEVTQGTRQLNTEEPGGVGLDRATWFTKHEVAARLGITTKTVERIARDGDLQQARWRRPSGGPMVVVYHPHDVARLMKERPPNALGGLLGPSPEPPPPTPEPRDVQTIHVPARPEAPTWDDLVREFATLLLPLSQTSGSLLSQTSSAKLFLTLDEAAALSGLSVTYLKRAVNAGSIPAVKDGRRWRVRRRDLEGL